MIKIVRKLKPVPLISEFCEESRMRKESKNYLKIIRKQIKWIREKIIRLKKGLWGIHIFEMRSLGMEIWIAWNTLSSSTPLHFLVTNYNSIVIITDSPDSNFIFSIICDSTKSCKNRSICVTISNMMPYSTMQTSINATPKTITYTPPFTPLGTKLKRDRFIKRRSIEDFMHFNTITSTLRSWKSKKWGKICDFLFFCHVEKNEE